MGIFDPRTCPAVAWLSAFLGVHASRLRRARHAGDLGASAIELAIITAVLLGLAVFLLKVITDFVTKQSGHIQNQVVPSP